MKPHCPWWLCWPLSLHYMVSGGLWDCGEDPEIMAMLSALQRTSDGTSAPAVFISHLTASLPASMLWPFLQQPAAHICNLLAPHLFLLSLIFCSCICQVRHLVWVCAVMPSQVHTPVWTRQLTLRQPLTVGEGEPFPQTHTYLEFLWLD